MQSPDHGHPAAGPIPSPVLGRWLIAILICLYLIVTAICIADGDGIRWDFANFYDTGRRMAAGQSRDIYRAHTEIAGQAPLAHPSMKFFSAPLSAYLYLPLGMLTPTSALALFKLQSAVFLLLALLLLYRRCLACLPQNSQLHLHFSIAFIVLACLYQPFWSIYVVGGQTTPLVFFLFTLALVQYTAGRLLFAAGLIVFALAIKPGFLLFAGLLSLMAGLRFIGFVAAWGAVAGMLSMLLLGWEVHLDFLRSMRSGAGGTQIWLWNSSLTVLIDNLSDWYTVNSATPPSLLRLAGTLVRLSVLAGAAMLYRAAASHTWPAPQQRHFQFILALTTGLLVMPIVWEHYLALLFIPLGFLLANSYRLPRAAQWILAAVFVLCLGQSVRVTYWLADRIQFQAVLPLVVAAAFKSAPLLLTGLLMVKFRKQVFETYQNV